MGEGHLFFKVLASSSAVPKVGDQAANCGETHVLLHLITLGGMY